MEFLLKRGIPLPANRDMLIKILRGIERLKKNDYKVKLGSLLVPAQRKYCVENNFKLLKSALRESL